MRKRIPALAASAALITLVLTGAASATTVGVTMDRFDDTFLAIVRHAIGDAAKAKGVTLTVEDAGDDTATQIGQVQGFIARKVDAIIVNPVDTSATPRITRLAVAAKIPLVYVNRRPEDQTLPANVSFVGSDEKVAGQLEGQELAKCLKGKGDVVVIQGQLSNNAAVDRTASVEQAITTSSDVKVVQKQAANWDRAQATSLMRKWMTDGAKISGVAANNDEMAIGAIEALKQAGVDPKTLCIGGVDATAAGLAEIANGNMVVTVFQNAKGQGQGAIDTALMLARHEKAPSYVDVPLEKVTRDNYKNYAQ